LLHLRLYQEYHPATPAPPALNFQMEKFEFKFNPIVLRFKLISNSSCFLSPASNFQPPVSCFLLPASCLQTKTPSQSSRKTPPIPAIRVLPQLVYRKNDDLRHF